MIVSMLSMPEGTLARGHVSQARERLATSRFLFVDVELPEETTPGEQPLDLPAADLPDGFFGMNFAYLTDELESGAVFWLLAVGLQVVFLLAALYVLHRTRLWRRLREDDGDLDDA